MTPKVRNDKFSLMKTLLSPNIIDFETLLTFKIIPLVITDWVYYSLAFERLDPVDNTKSVVTFHKMSQGLKNLLRFRIVTEVHKIVQDSTCGGLTGIVCSEASVARGLKNHEFKTVKQNRKPSKVGPEERVAKICLSTIRTLSKAYPDKVFIVKGDGKNSTDIEKLVLNAMVGYRKSNPEVIARFYKKNSIRIAEA